MNDEYELERIRRKKLQELIKSMSGNTSADASGQQSAGWPDKTIKVSDANFHETIKKYPFAVIDCWAAWCGPCKMMAPVLDGMAKDYKGKILFGKLNVDENRQTSMEYGIMSIPTMLVFKNGEKVDQIVGAMPRNVLEPQITKHL